MFECILSASVVGVPAMRLKDREVMVAALSDRKRGGLVPLNFKPWDQLPPNRTIIIRHHNVYGHKIEVGVL